jgi:outer membrane protein assembly factor BamB
MKWQRNALDTGRGKDLFPVPSVPSPAAGDGRIVLAGGIALRPGSEQTPPKLLWRSTKLRPAYASLLHYHGRVYALNNSAILLNCFDASDGKVVWQERLKGPFSVSPVAADGHIYVVNEDGITTVLEAGDQARVVSTNSLPETILATPALAGGAIYLRSDRHLICVGEKN